MLISIFIQKKNESVSQLEILSLHVELTFFNQLNLIKYQKYFCQRILQKIEIKFRLFDLLFSKMNFMVSLCFLLFLVKDLFNSIFFFLIPDEMESTRDSSWK